MYIRLKLKSLLVAITIAASQFNAAAQGDIVYDPTNFAELALQGEEAVQNFLQLFETLTGMGEQLAEAKNVIATVYEGTQTIVRTGTALTGIYEASMRIANESKANLERYTSLANAGLLAPMQLRDALAQTNVLAQESMGMLGATLGFCNSLASFTPKDAIDFLEEIESGLSRIAARNADLYDEVERSAFLTQRNREQKEIKAIITGVSDVKKPKHARGGGQSKINFFDNNGRVIESPISNDVTTTTLSDPHQAVEAAEVAAKEIVEYLSVYQNPLYLLAMGLLFVLGICMSAIGGYKMMKGGESRSILLDVGLGFILISALMSVLKLTANLS